MEKTEEMERYGKSRIMEGLEMMENMERAESWKEWEKQHHRKGENDGGNGTGQRLHHNWQPS